MGVPHWRRDAAEGRANRDGANAGAQAPDVVALSRHARTVKRMTDHLDQLDRSFAAVSESWYRGDFGVPEFDRAFQQYQERRERLLSQLHRAYAAATAYLAGLPG